MKTIVLTGMMGSGKSTIGKILAMNLGCKYIDIDNYIEQKENISISNIFDSKGEKYFRQIEKNIIKEVFIPENLVISLGGGAFEDLTTQEFLLLNSTTIYLKTSPKIIFERIKNNTERPLLKDRMTIEKISEILTNREKNYKKAFKTIITDSKTPEEIIQEIIGAL